MLKKFCAIALALFAVIAAGAEKPRLTVGNAANGAPVNIVQHEALKMAFSGEYEVAMKHLKPSEALSALQHHEVDMLILDTRFLPEKRAGWRIYPYAAEALCFYIHPGNPLGSLTKAEAVKILTAAQPHWREYNGSAADIQRIMLKSGSAGATLVNRVLGNLDLAAGIFRVSNLPQLFAFLNPAALGAGPFQPERRAEIIAVPVHDIAPTTATVSAGTYPLTVQYALICRETPAPAVEKLLNSVLAPAALKKLYDLNMIPVWKGQQL